uniref:Selenoprotein S n=1 Tax=Strongyloides papillosus TaxID=174720 RepID=A0A0N5BKH3_STREA
MLFEIYDYINYLFKSLWFYIKMNGWYLMFLSIVLFYVYVKYLKTMIMEYYERKEYEKRKKFDASVEEKYSKNIEEARRRAQERYNMNKHKYREEEEKKKKEELEKKIHNLDDKITKMRKMEGFKGVGHKVF